MPYEIHENYKEYRPPLNVRAAVTRLLRSVPPQNVPELGAIVLTNATAQRSTRTSRLGGRKWRPRESLGIYHGRTSSAAPWIELLIDNVLEGWPPGLLRFALFQDLAIASTLYHEIGHHMDACVGGRREPEASADEWAKKLGRIHFRRRYWYVVPAVVPARLVVRALIRARNAIRRTIVAR
jgi:hypothetical protein